MTTPAFLRDPRITRVAAIILLQYFAVEWVVSASWRGQYTYRTNLTSTLGIPFCGPQGNWPCNALYPAMNVSFVITGVAIVVIGASWLVRRVLETPPAVAIMISGAGLVLAGLVTEQTDYPTHVTAMTVFYVFGALGTLLAGVSAHSRLAVRARGALIIGGAISTVGFFCFAGGLTGLLGSGGTERTIIYGILIALLVAGITGTHKPAPEEPESASATTEPESAVTATTEQATP
ncbi:DUF998 domain-containing protein [Gordonia sp. CPCC 205515]|uniref:DUF998 domain-containing protein n=1 Tax=Gordonia sp. CPCC 205515 TaxID=3140791 RepID=UPI003AF4034B